VQTFPPSLFSGTRFLAAGVLLLIVCLAIGRKLPRRREDWKTAAVVGIVLLTLGNGLVVAGARFVDSGTAATLVLGGALWMALLDAWIPGSEARVTWTQLVGLLIGYSGALLMLGGSAENLRRVDWRGPLFFVGTNICWGFGSVYSKRHPVETTPDMHAALQMLIGGALLVTIGLATGEWRNFSPAPVAWASIAYLIVFGSIVGYSCFVYVLRHTSPTVTATYYYVNTVIAVALGAIILHERITARTFFAVAVVLGSVIWVQRAGRSSS
jgi:drug/metabolite transporter (DMT)-like permease